MEAIRVLFGRWVSPKDVLHAMEIVRGQQIERYKMLSKNTAEIVRYALNHPDEYCPDLLNYFIWNLKSYMTEGGGALSLEDFDFSESEKDQIRKLLSGVVSPPVLRVNRSK